MKELGPTNKLLKILEKAAEASKFRSPFNFFYPLGQVVSTSSNNNYGTYKFD